MKPKLKIKLLTASLMMVVVSLFMFFFGLALNVPEFVCFITALILSVGSFFFTWNYIDQNIKKHVDLRKKQALVRATPPGEMRHIQKSICDNCGEVGYLDYHLDGWNYCSEACMKEGKEAIKELREQS